MKGEVWVILHWVNGNCEVRGVCGDAETAWQLASTTKGAIAIDGPHVVDEIHAVKVCTPTEEG